MSAESSTSESRDKGIVLPPGVELVVQGKSHEVGGVEVSRALPERRRRNVGPFVFLDHMGPVKMPAGQGMDVPPHPHIGLSTVSYLFEGQMFHRDSIGSACAIEPGAINLMAAGNGIAHSERSTPEARAAGAVMHGLQLWLALPLDRENGAPSFQHHAAETLPSWDENGASVRLLLGELNGRRSPATDPSRPLFVDVDLPAGASFHVPAAPAEFPERAVYIIRGELAVADARFGAGQLLVLAPDSPVQLNANTHTRLVLIGGPPLDAHRYMEWNFVSSSRERIEKAKADWQGGRFPRIPGDDSEFIPLPTYGAAHVRRDPGTR